MKVRVLARDSELYTRGKKSENNHAPDAHPLKNLQEYQRALAAAKMERMFAKPFVAALEGHLDAVSCLARSHKTVQDVYSGSCDGEIRFWRLGTRVCQRSIVKGHDGHVEGVAVAKDDTYLLSCGRDQYIKQWAVEKHFRVGLAAEADIENRGGVIHHDLWQDGAGSVGSIRPVNTFHDPDGPLFGVDSHDEASRFVTAGSRVSVWDLSKTAPVAQMASGAGGCVQRFVQWSPSDMNLVLSASSNNTVELFDVRQGDMVQSVALAMQSNSGAWNPMRPFEFAVANDDHNVYTFDIRNFASAKHVYCGFVHAALSVAYAPTGKELCAGGQDETVRIWTHGERFSRDVYHNRRMQSVTSVLYSGDSKYILSGSADFNVRLWKANASEKLNGAVSRKEADAINYRRALLRKYAHMPQVKHIQHQRHLPKYIYNMNKQKLVHHKADRERKERGGQIIKPLRQSPIRHTSVQDAAKPKVVPRGQTDQDPQDDDDQEEDDNMSSEASDE
ncbi:SOF1-like domain protein [Gregarina niphandrodes]|uniref:SOF1-like domain protein n=1 Tax=Gregarina niphandrodes TaxID=110365 RepID=A0A023B3T5_GRENI|nr:SOF1-like domain protein [Gregarina niphandrodes]EZG55933.1 SOF1-like domain protein [Gregarina niphandrodes]|eukprot:XP_011131407.1 SOF1-like domain protein [Gregarina niphandrodes]